MLPITPALRGALILSAIALVAGCASNTEMTSVETLRTMASQMAADRDQATQDPRTVLTPAIIASVNQPYLLAEIASRQASATRIIFHQNASMQDWRGPDGISLILDDGVLIATRGLGEDLFAADPLPEDRLTTSTSQSYTRNYRHLEGDNREVITAFTCQLVRNGPEQIDLIAQIVPTIKLSETCVSTDPATVPIVNAYWIDATDAFIWQSRQWISNTVGHVTLSRLLR